MKTLPKLLLALYCMSVFTSYSQDLSINLDEIKETYTVATKENDSAYIVKLTCSSCSEEYERKFKLTISPISINDSILFFSPEKMMFGEGFQKEQELKVMINFDDDNHLFKLEIKEETEEENEETERSDTVEENIEPMDKTVYLVFKKENSSPSDVRLKKTVDELESGIEMLKKQLIDGDNSKEYIGRFVIKQEATVFKGVDKNSLKKIVAELKNEKTTIAQFKKKNGTTQKIDSVTIKITEGLIEYIKVRMGDGTYFINTKAPIQIITMEKRFNDLLFNPETNDFIILKDAVIFDANQRFNYLPDNHEPIHIVNDKNVTEKKPAYEEIYASAGLNSFVDLRIYSDLLAVFDNQANGLVQFEASSKLYLHRWNIFNDFAYLGYAIEPFFHLNKLDSKYDTIQFVDNSINRMELFRRSNFYAGIKLNAFRWDWRPSNSFFINLGYMFSSGTIAFKDETETNGILHTPFVQVGFSSKRLRNFGFEGSVEGLLQKLNKNQKLIDNGLAIDDKWHKLMSFNVTMYFFQAKKADDKFFVRFKNYLNFSERGDDFYQLQFGYSKNLSL